MTKQTPAPQPVPDDEVPERVVANPETQERGDSEWQGWAPDEAS